MEGMSATLTGANQARVSFQADGTCDAAKHSKRGAIAHGSSELSMLATPAHRKDEAEPSFERAPDSRAASGRRTQRKKGPVATPDAATPDSLSAMTPQAGALLDLAIPLTFEEIDVRSTSSTPSAAVGTAGAAFRAVLMSARESFDFESAAEKLFESSQLQLLLVEGVACEPVPVAAALCVMAQASDFMNTMLCKDGCALDQMAAEALQSVGFSLCMLACKVEQEHGRQQGNELQSQRKELMESSIKLIGTFLRQWSWASVDEGGERPAQKRARVSAAVQDSLCSAAAASMQALDRCAQDASHARHWMAIMKLALDAVLCDQLPVVQAEGIKLLKSLFASNSEQRASVLDEIFFLLDDDRVGRRAKKSKGIKVPGSCGSYMQPVNAALLLLLQSIPAASSSASVLQDLDHVKKVTNYLFDLFEKRFEERASLKGKDVKEELKDAASRTFLTDLVDDILEVLGLPFWPVAEEVFNVLLLRCGKFIGKGPQCISVPHKALMVDIVSASFLGLVKYSHRMHDKLLDAGLDLELTKQLEVQQEGFCATYGELSRRSTMISAPIKLAQDRPGAEDVVLEEAVRQVVLNYLASNFSRPSGVSHDAFVYRLLRWSSTGVQEEQEDASTEDAETQRFWGAQLDCALQKQLGCVKASAPVHQIAEQQVELFSMKLTLNGALFSKIPKRLRSFLHHLTHGNDGKGSDKAKVLRMVTTLVALQPDLLDKGFLRLVADDFLLAGDNANVRASAVELLSGVCLGKMRQSLDDSHSQDAFDALAARKADVSVKVRQAVATFLHEVASLARPQAPLLGEAYFPQLVGAHVYKYVDGNLLTGRVVGFDQALRLHKVEYGLPGMSSSQNECENISFDSLKTSLVLATDPDDASVGDPSRGFKVGRRFVAACSHLCALLMSEEESIFKFVLEALQELWFTGAELPPVNSCVEEIVAIFNSLRVQTGDHGRNAAWLGRLLGQLPEEASTRCQQYVDVLFCKISAIENISPVESSGAGRPSCFNDFDTRAKMLLPLLLTLKPFAKRMPQYAFPHIGKILPVLATMEVSASHLFVLRMLQDILSDVVCCHRDRAAAQGRLLKLELDQAKLQKLQTKGKNQALDAKLKDLEEKLARNAEPSLALELEASLLRCYQQGAFKLSDASRWQSFEDISRATQALCAIVSCNRTPSSVAYLLKVFSHFVTVMKNFIEAPSDERAAWIPRALCVAGNIVRHFDIDSVKDAEALQAKKNFVVMAVAHFPNNARESVRRATLHALGSTFVRDPQLMLNRTVVKLMKDCLAPEKPNGSQLQVLKNLTDHFVQEEAEIVALTAAASQQDAPVVLVSDTSTSLIQQFHALILESSLSAAPKIRDQAVQLMRVILHRGLTASYLLIPYLLAQQCKTDATASEALRILGVIHQKEPSRLTTQALWDGVEKAFRMCQPASQPAGPSDLPVEAFVGAFRLIATNDKEKASKSVRSFLAMAMRSFDQLEHETGSKKESTLGFKLFVARVLAQLPYHSLDSVQMLIKMIQDRTTALGGSCMEGLGRFLAASQEALGDRPGGTGLARWILEAQCLSVLVQLDAFLQHVYCIKPERLRKFLADPKTLDKTPVKDSLTDRPAFRISVHFDASLADAATKLTPDAAVELRQQYKGLRELMRGSFVGEGVDLLDEDDSEPVQSKAKKPKARSKDKKKEQETEDADEDMHEDMDASEASEPRRVQRRDEGSASSRVKSARKASSRAKRARSEIDSESSETETPAKPAVAEKVSKAGAKSSKGKSRKKA